MNPCVTLLLKTASSLTPMIQIFQKAAMDRFYHHWPQAPVIDRERERAPPDKPGPHRGHGHGAYHAWQWR
jgi:hypothetical protein